VEERLISCYNGTGLSKSINFEAINEFSSESTSDEDAGVPSTGVVSNGK